MTDSAAWHRHREEITMANPDTYHLLLGLLFFSDSSAQNRDKKRISHKIGKLPPKKTKSLLGPGLLLPKRTLPNPILVQNMRCEMMADPFS